MKKTITKSYFRIQIVLIFMLLLQISVLPQKQEIADEMKHALINGVLDVWYPKTVDSTHGGFLTNFDFKWEPFGTQNKMLVTQTRHIWTTAKMAEFLDDDKYGQIAHHGYLFLKTKMWDSVYGGFYFLRDREGNKIPSSSNNKSSYSNSFAIFSLAAYFGASGDSSALNLAIDCFKWLEKNAHDPVNKGYFDLLREDGTRQILTENRLGLRYNIHPSWKDQNSSIHLLEAFTELYSVWSDSLLKVRLSEMLNLVRDKITTEKGYLALYLTEDWQPISFKDSTNEVREANSYIDHVSFGHDIETAFLMLEASHSLKIIHEIKTLEIAKKMVDHALDFGWDNSKGGFYYEGYYNKDNVTLNIIDSSKVWWVQAEGLNSLLLMSKLFPDEKKYYNAFLKQWDYIKLYMIDHKYKEWYSKGIDINPEMITSPKAFDWKVNYHNVRGLMNCIKMLTEE